MGADAKHVFISYVREDDARVDELCGMFEAAQIPYWRDRNSLAPGDAWKGEIRKAIQSGSLVFLACFSDASRAREKSYMNEELTLAVEEFRQLPPGRPWLIPVRFDNGDVPAWDLGAGRLLSDLNFADLFGDRYVAQAAGLISTITRQLGGSSAGVDASAAVAELDDFRRGPSLRRLTKEMLLDPARRIELDDLINGEVRRVRTAMSDTNVFPRSWDLDEPDHERQALDTTKRYLSLVLPFCFSLQVAARWASPAQLQPWVAGLRTFASAAVKLQDGINILSDLRHLVPTTAIMTASVSAVAADTWSSFDTLLAQPTVTSPYGDGSQPLLSASGPWDPFSNLDPIASAIVRSILADRDFDQTREELRGGKIGRLHTPLAELLHATLRPVFDEQLQDDNEYDEAFDRAEVMTGLVSQDVAMARYGGNEQTEFLARSNWFGRSTYRGRRGQGAISAISDEFNRDAKEWAPLRSGLFGSSLKRAADAFAEYTAKFNAIAHNQF